MPTYSITSPPLSLFPGDISFGFLNEPTARRFVVVARVPRTRGLLYSLLPIRGSEL